MHRYKIIFVFSFAILFRVANGQVSPELQRIDSVVQGLYEGLSFDDGQLRDAKIKQFFFTDSRIISNFGATPQSSTLAQYISSVQGNIQKQGILVVAERELFNETDIFGKVAQRLSTYEIKFTFKEKNEIVRRGINLIQLIKVGGKWKVNSIIWDRESDQLKIPAEYIPK